MKFFDCERLIFNILLLSCVLPCFFACTGKDVPLPEEIKKRNILFYIAADNNRLENEPQQKINEIRKGWISGRGEMIIYTDQTDKGGCLMRISDNLDSDGYYGLDTLANYGSENSTDPSVIRRAIDSLLNYPADSYGMIYFSHGSGWLPEGTYSSPRSLGRDNGTGNSYETEIEKFSAVVPDGKFDFIILEACLMADVMSMYEFRNDAKYILASCAEIVSPGFSKIYKDNIMKLYYTDRPVSSLLRDFGQAYYNFVKTDLTLSLINMDEMENLAGVTKDALHGIPINEVNLDVKSIQHFDRPRGSGGGPNTSLSRYFDFEHIMKNLVSADKYLNIQRQLEKTVEDKWNSEYFLFGGGYNGFKIEHYCGLSAYIEQDKTNLDYTNRYYHETSWYKAIYGE